MFVKRGVGMKTWWHHNAVARTSLLNLGLLFLALALLCAVFTCYGCGDNNKTARDSGEDVSLEENLQNLTNKLEFEISEPMYTLLTAKVLKVEDLDPFDLVLVEVKDSRFPSGLKSNPYEGKSIAPGTWLAVEWASDTKPQVDKVYVIPSEFIKAVNGIRVSLKGTPREAPAQTEEGEVEGD